MEYQLLEIKAPEMNVWREDDGTDMIRVTYLLDPTARGTRFTQRDEAQLGASGLLHPLMRVGIGVDIGRQLRELRKLLEKQ